jgi:UDP:flavonoid glycosyltransferase YjiC (YdhE family)
MDETSVDDLDDALATWIKSKPSNSMLYGAFGSSSLIPYDRMYNLINGLAKFLLQTDSSFLLLALRNANYDVYQAVLKDLLNDEIRKILENKQRVWIEKGFVKQKWILRQKSVKVFLSHCGMGSTMEALYFSKLILGMPFSSEQFANAIAIENLNVGQSLFVPPSAIQNLLNPYDLVQYTFTAESVTSKILDLWMNVAYEKVAREISLEMKHAGGVKRAVEEIEFFVKLDQ